MHVPFRIKTAFDMFQKEIKNILLSYEGTKNSVNSMLIYTPNVNTPRARTTFVILALRSTRAKLNKEM